MQFAIAAEKGGFETIVTSDHFHPWFNTDASDGFAWAWMAAGAMTKKIEIGSKAKNKLGRAMEKQSPVLFQSTDCLKEVALQSQGYVG